MSTMKGRKLAHDMGLSEFGHEAEICSTLARLATRADNLAEEACNGPGAWVNRIPYPEAGEILSRWQTGLESRQGRNEARIAAAIAQLPGYTATVHGDPRGWVVTITTPTGRECGI